MKVKGFKILCLIISFVLILHGNVFCATLDPTDAPTNVTVANNAGIKDTVNVEGLCPEDVVKVYNALTDGNLLGTGIVLKNSTGVTVELKSKIGPLPGSVYVSVTSKGMGESSRTKADYAAEQTSVAPTASNVSISNNVGTADIVTVTDLSDGDVVSVYNALSGGRLLGKATVGSSDIEAVVKIPQLGTSAGSIYVAVTSYGMLISSRTKADYLAEPKSEDPNSDYIVITNNAGISDTVCVSGVSEGDVVKVYSALSGGKLLGSITVAATKTEATITISQLGSAAGSVYVTVTSKGLLESNRVKSDYSAEPKTTAPDVDSISIANYAGVSDTIIVSNLVAGDVVKIYNSLTGGKMLGSATVAASNTEATATILQLGSAAGSVYVTVTTKGLLESTRIKADYTAEAKSDVPNTNDIEIINNAGVADTVTVAGLAATDVVKVYNALTGGKLLGSATVAAKMTEATITISQLGSAAGSVYVTVTTKGLLESSRVKSDYSAEPKTPDPDVNNISIINNAGASDTITVSALAAGDVVKVYNLATGGKLLGSKTVADSNTEATVTISQLGSAAGSVYVTVTSKGVLESNRIKADYIAEPKSDAPVAASDISIINNAGIADIVTVTSLSDEDVVRVYNAAVGGKMLGTVTAKSSEASVTIAQLSTALGSVYVTVTSKGMRESDRTKADYIAEVKTVAPVAANITVVNNTGSQDTVNLVGVSEGDVVKVYNAATAGNLLGSATVPTFKTEITVNIQQLGTAAGSVWVTVTSKGMQESARTIAAYIAEGITQAPLPANIIVDNNAGFADTVAVSQLSGGDIVNVYNAAKGGTLIGTGKVDIFDTDVTITITQLGSAAGSIYVSVMSKNKVESDRTSVAYLAEIKSAVLVASDISITNNIGKEDTIDVTNISEGDVVKVYSLPSGGRLLGSGTVAVSGSSVTIKISQLGPSGGSVYVSVKRYGKLESDRVKIDFSAE